MMKLKPKKKLRRWFAAGLLAPAIGIATPSVLPAQDVSGGLNQAGDAAERGLREATRGILEGRSPGESIQRGLDESIRSATESPEQTLRRDEWRGQDQARRQWSDPAPDTEFRGTQRPVYHRDEFGRPFFVDSIGQRFVYQDGRWMRAQGYRSEAQGFQPGQPMDRRGDVARRGTDTWRDSAPPRLGVSINESPRGLRVNDVERQSPAAMAGIQPGDVILRANGQQVRTPQSFVQTVQNLDQGEELDLTVLRNGREESLTATLSGDDTRRMAKPAIDGEPQETPQALRQRVQQLEQELDQLRQRMERMASEDAAGQQGGIQSVLNQQESETEAAGAREAEAAGQAAGESRQGGAAEAASGQEAAPEGDGPLDDLLDTDTGLNTDAGAAAEGNPPTGQGNAGSGNG